MIYTRGSVFKSGSQATPLRYSLETFRGVGFSSHVPGQREAPSEEAEDEEEKVVAGDKGVAVSGIRAGQGVVSSFRFCRRNGRTRRASERRVSYTPRVQRPLIWNTYTGGYSASLYSTRMQISSILDFSWMRRSGGWWLVLRGSHFPSPTPFFPPSLSSTRPAASLCF